MQISPKAARYLGLGAAALLVAVLVFSLGRGARSPLPTPSTDLAGNSGAAATSLSKPALATASPTGSGKNRPAKASSTAPVPAQPVAPTLPEATSTGSLVSASTSTSATATTQPAQALAPTATTRLASSTQAPTATTASANTQPTATSPAPTATSAPANPTATLPASTGPVLVTGRILRDSAPASGVVINLETAELLTTTTDAGGYYTFTTSLPEGDYSVTFSQDANPALSADTQVASWAWLEGYAAAGITGIEMPDMDISLLLNGHKFEQQKPAANAAVSASGISRSSPLRFEWSTYPQPLGYWVDLGRENETTPVWQSFFTTSPYFNFTGLLSGGATISPGNYWWNIGMQKKVGIHTLIVYGHAWALVITP